MPYGFICGFPTGGGGDLYGGNAYVAAAQRESPQALAQAAACARWGEAGGGRAGAAPVIPFSVCKGKYRPWSQDGQERMLGCFRHHAIRKRRVARAGLRDGWESFEQWPRPGS